MGANYAVGILGADNWFDGGRLLFHPAIRGADSRNLWEYKEQCGEREFDFRQISTVNAWVAQLVEHSPEEGRVRSSILRPGTKLYLYRFYSYGISSYHIFPSQSVIIYPLHYRIFLMHFV